MEKTENLERIENIFGADLRYGSSKQYLWHLREYFKWLKLSGITDVTQIKKPMKTIQDYVYFRTIEADSPWVKPYVKVAFYAIKKFWEKIQFIKIDKDFFTNTGVESKHEPRILTRREVDKVWRFAHDTLGEVETLMAHVGWEAALRTGELVTLKGGNFLKDGTLDVRVLKTKRARKEVPLSAETFERVKTLITSSGRYVFRHEIEKGYSKIRRYTSLLWSKYFHKWTSSFLGAEGIRWHDFARHTRLTHYAEDTKSFLAVLQLSGHQNPRVCRQYFERAKIVVPELEVIKAQEWNW